MKTRLAGLAVVVVLATSAIGMPMAAAAFSTTAPASATYASSAIAAPTNVTFTCTNSHTAQVSWTATTSTYATGYTLLDTVNGGSQQVVQTGITGAAVTITVVHRSNYTVALESTYQSWTSPTSTWTTSASC